MTKITDNDQGTTALAPASLFNDEIIQPCSAVVEKYHGGTIDKVNALFTIHDLLPHDAGSSEVQRGALQSYSSMLDNFERIHNTTGNYGGAAAGEYACAQNADIPNLDDD